MAYNKHDRKAYKYFVFNPHNSKILGGFEFKDDAKEHKNQLNFTGLKVYTRSYLQRIGIMPRSNKNWGTDLGIARYKPQNEVVLAGDFRKQVQIPEVKLRYNRGKTFGKIRNSDDVYRFLKRVYGRSIDIQEQFVMLLTDNSLNILGYYKHTVGTPVSTMADIPMLISIVLKSMARSFIIAHNHPSGNNIPSAEDRALTKAMEKAAKSVKLKLLDHIIITKQNGYFSFIDNGELSGLHGFKTSKEKKSSLEDKLRNEIISQLKIVNQKPDLTPKIHSLIQSKNGYKWVENRIINMMISDRITVSSCIPQIESEL